VGAIPPPLFFERRALKSDCRSGDSISGTPRKQISVGRKGRQTSISPAPGWVAAEGYLRMANTTSAKKATRKIARRTIVNKSRRTQMRSALRTVEDAIKTGDAKAAKEAMKLAEPALMKAAQRNIVHKNLASRKVSRLSHQIAKLAQ